MENKVKEIIRKEFDLRVSSMVVAYILDKGIHFCTSITEEDIDNIEGNGLMTQDFVQSLVRASSRIAKECDVNVDILPYIIDSCDARELSYDRLLELFKYSWNMLSASSQEDLMYDMTDEELETLGFECE